MFKPNSEKRQLRTAEAAFNFAVNSLAAKGQTESEIRRKLAERRTSPEHIEIAIQRCKDYNYINDQRFLETRGRALVSQGRKIGFQAVRDLELKGVSRVEAQTFIDDFQDSTDLPAIILDRLNSRYPNLDLETISSKERNRILNYFIRRGFSYSQVNEAFERFKSSEND